jgi:hypothetical protein
LGRGNPCTLVTMKTTLPRRFVLPRQEWRIDAMILLMDSAAKCGWSEGFERVQGSLLGYENWQNDIFIEKIYRPAHEKR